MPCARNDAFAAARGHTRSAALRALVLDGVDAPRPKLPDEAELLGRLADAARRGNIRATELLLRRSGKRGPIAGMRPSEPDAFAAVDELAARRRSAERHGE